MKTKQNIIQVSYGRTVNIGNYQSVRFDFVARVDNDEDWRDIYEELKSQALREEKRIAKEGY